MNTGQVSVSPRVWRPRCSSFAAVAQAHAVRRFDTAPDSLVGFVLRSVRDPWILGVVAAYLAGFLLHAVAIWLLPLPRGRDRHVAAGDR